MIFVHMESGNSSVLNSDGSFSSRGNQTTGRRQSFGALVDDRWDDTSRPVVTIQYDACGRMVLDFDNSIRKVVYNDLSLPSSIEYLASENALIPYPYGVQYAADGRKLCSGRMVSEEEGRGCY